MLTITIPELELFNEETNEFYTLDAVRLDLEHSLVSLSKWESKWEKPFLGDKEKTTEETLWYIRAMVITPDVPEEVFRRITSANIDDIHKYISAKMTATWFREDTNPTGPHQVVTAEILYYNMIKLGIPFECENWHLNRLITLIRVINQKDAPPKKMSPSELAKIKAERRAKYGTKG